MNEKTDQELLDDFADRRAEGAFSELARRYVDLVHSAAVRLVVDPHLAEDVSQNVFVALAKQAGEVKRKLACGAPLSGWLHLTTRNFAAKTVRTEARRRAREQEAAAMRELSSASSETGWDQIAPYLDHALAELSEPDRDALLFRFFERKTAREIGERLGLTEEAAQKRVLRALDRLRHIFAARGVALSSTTLGTIMAAHAVKAAPGALALGISQFAVSAVVTTATPAGMLSWLTHLTSHLAMTKVQTGILIVATVAVALPIGQQQIELNRLHAELTAARATLEMPNVARPDSTKVASFAARSEADEIARLRREAQNLRAQIEARRGRAQASDRPPPGATLLKIGQSVPLTDLVFAGNDTPAAALQSLLCLARDGDIEAYFNMNLLSPRDAEEMNRARASAQKWEEGIRYLHEQVRGIAAIEILAENPITERRTQIVYKAIKQDGVTTNTHGFGLSSRGWLQLP